MHTQLHSRELNISLYGQNVISVSVLVAQLNFSEFREFKKTCELADGFYVIRRIHMLISKFQTSLSLIL